MAQPAKKGLPFTTLSRLGKAKAKEFTIQGLFKYGYRNKEDISNLPPETLVIGSQNVLTNAAELVGIRQGYVLDGAAGNQNTYGIDSSYDFYTRTGVVHNLRKWGGNLETRYYNPNTKLVSWINILSTLNPANLVNFTTFYDQLTEQSNFCLFVNGNKNVYEWSGAIGSVAAVSNASGIISSITNTPNTDQYTSGGVNYAVGDTLTISGGDGTATLEVLSIANGGVGSISVGAGGTGYNVGDILIIQHQGTTLTNVPTAIVKVATVDGSNHITGLTLITAGQGYLAGQLLNLITSTGGGSGGTVNIVSVGNTITNWQLLTNGTGYSAAQNVATTGGSGTAATVEILAVGTNSITLQGSLNCQQLGFYSTSANSGKFQVLINGNTYSYTASNANGGQTLVGIAPSPVGAGISVGDAVIQVPVIGLAASASVIDIHFNFSLISTLRNQIWYGDTTRSDIWISQSSNYQNLTPSATLAQGGAQSGNLDASPVAFYPQGVQMYISAGVNEWWLGDFQETSLVVNGTTISNTETFFLNRLKTAVNQGAQSQALVTQFKNALVYVSNEPIINSFGLVKDIYSFGSAAPQITNISDPIKYDMDAYNFTGGSIYYFNYFIYVAIPKMGVVRMYNVIKKYWEAPQILPVSSFYQISGVLYGHSALTNESYQMFTGYNDNGNPINAVAAFPYLSLTGGSANEKKDFNKILTEGYISANSTLTLGINYDFGGYSGSYSTDINGNNLSPKNIIFNKVTDGSLGQNTLGSQPIGQVLNLAPGSNNPKFRVINTMPRVPVFEYQITYSSNDTDFQWQILRFGPAVNSASALPTEITN